MNTPVGIPSGWEELCAWCFGMYLDQLNVWQTHAWIDDAHGGKDCCFGQCNDQHHDWRVLE